MQMRLQAGHSVAGDHPKAAGRHRSSVSTDEFSTIELI
jgi:hypothetical protein